MNPAEPAVRGMICGSSLTSIMVRALVIAAGVVAWGIVPAQQQQSALSDPKAKLELEKLELEVKKLRAEARYPPAWVIGLVSGILGAFGAIASLRVARVGIFGALDQAVHQKRLELYPKLLKATQELALYFPATKTIDPSQCAAMGARLRTWYFEGGGILFSNEARDAYFRLMRALTRASLAQRLLVPMFPEDAENISVETVDTYRAQIARDSDLDGVEKWLFGSRKSDTSVHDSSESVLVQRPKSKLRMTIKQWLLGGRKSALSAGRFRDFVFLQRLSSKLRTAMTQDLRSRRRPGT